ncbi:class I SAM-dependent methyltransferase [Laspinema olomoucense]|uniref:class I SAM-dependent methyltransferase n=1 Tax=Laspinema olomoucense TaxID=3231600 RepID=UPI0021BB52E7|nr:class I SAM-dependent methyltransferase [Laspinema sp. D3d]MCT7972015.1 class I SAM-dependent methyltransferase [Laspinema sp. D3d]
MTLQIKTSCITCGSDKGKFLLNKALDGRGEGEINLFQCQNCQTVYLQDWPLEFVPELYDYYASRFHQDKQTLYEPINDSRLKSVLTSLKPLVKGQKMLDVGCGEGQFVDVALRCGWDASGIELSDSAVAICQNFGLPVQKIDLFDQTLETNSFDLITLSEVIEHISHPAPFIARTAQLLKPEGLLYLTTPNFDSLDRRILGADWRVIHREHLSYFTPSTLKYLIENNTNLKVFYIETKHFSLESIGRLRPQILPDQDLTNNDNQIKTIETVERDQLLRHKIEFSNSLKIIKFGINKMLNLFGLGSAMVSLCRKNS